METMGQQFQSFGSLDDVAVREPSNWKPPVGTTGTFSGYLTGMYIGQQDWPDGTSDSFVQFRYEFGEETEYAGKSFYGDRMMFTQSPDAPGISDNIRSLRESVQVRTRTSIYKGSGLSPEDVDSDTAATTLHDEIESSKRIPVEFRINVKNNPKKPQYPYLNDMIVSRD